MSNPNEKRKPEKGVYEAFRSDWLLQVAADREAKSAMPVAAVIAHKYLNRERGHAWPGVRSLMEATGAASENTVRNALRVLVKRGHAFIKWSDGGNGNTNIICPLVNKQPFKNLKGFDIAFDTSEPSTSDAETLQVSAPQPFKKLKATLLKEPSELQAEAIKASADVNNDLSHQLKDEENSSPRQAFAYAGLPDTGEEETIYIAEADEIDLDSCPNIERPEYDPDGPHTGDRIEIGEGASIEIAESEDETPVPDDDTHFEDDEWDEMIPFDSWSGTPAVAATDTRASKS